MALRDRYNPLNPGMQELCETNRTLQAYVAVLYLQVNIDDRCSSHLSISKARVNDIIELSVSRLKPMATLNEVRLVHFVINSVAFILAKTLALVMGTDSNVIRQKHKEQHRGV